MEIQTPDYSRSPVTDAALSHRQAMTSCTAPSCEQAPLALPMGRNLSHVTRNLPLGFPIADPLRLTREVLYRSFFFLRGILALLGLSLLRGFRTAHGYDRALRFVMRETLHINFTSKQIQNSMLQPTSIQLHQARCKRK